MLTIYDQGGVSSKAPVQKWVLALGGLGIVVGLALYGYKLIISLGYRMTKVSPSRGFAIELSAAIGGCGGILCWYSNQHYTGKLLLLAALACFQVFTLCNSTNT